MAKNTKQIALIQHRRGKLSELPTELNEGEFGLATDTNQLFIGNSDNEKLSTRVSENNFPYGNIEVLTEFTDNLTKIRYTYKSNTDITARLPIVITGTKPNPILPANSSIILNGEEIYFKNNSNLQTIVSTINSKDIDVKAYITNNSYLSLVSNSTEIVIEDGTVGTTGNVKKIGFSEDGFYSMTSELLPDRTLQESLDDRCSIKAYGVVGDGLTDDSENIYNAILSIYKAGSDNQYYRELYMPAGTYLMKQNSLPLPTGIHLKGDGCGRTIIKATSLIKNTLMMSMDDNYNMSNSLTFMDNSESIKYITLEDMTIDTSSETKQLLSIGSTENIIFRNVEFIGRIKSIHNSPGTTTIREYTSNLISITNGTNNNQTFNIIFENCIFRDCYNCIVSSANVEHLVIKNCSFKNILGNAILFNNSSNKIVNTIIDGNEFTDCGTMSKSIITISENCEYTSIINNKFDKTIIENKSSIKPYVSVSDTLYTDILDATTDERKLLQFKFTQPIWTYIDYLLNPNGEYILKSKYNTTISDGDEVIPTLTNGLVLQQGDETNDNTVTIGTSLSYGTLNISSGEFGSIDIGNSDNDVEEYSSEITYNIGDIVKIYTDDETLIYKCLVSNTGIGVDDETYWQNIEISDPKITIYKSLDLNDNSIVNNGSDENIDLTVNDGGVVTITNLVDDIKNNDEYVDKIASISNAVPTVKYVNRVANSMISQTIDYHTISSMSSNKYDLVLFDQTKYSDVVNIDKISINVRLPYYPIQELIDNAIEFKTGYKYYKGDVVKDEDERYYIALDDHIATDEESTNSHWDIVSKERLCSDGEIKILNDLKYVSIIASNDSEDTARLLFAKDLIDVSRRNIKGKYYQEWQPNFSYKASEIVSYKNRYWKCLQDNVSNDEYDLHIETLWTAVSEEGYNYIFDFDREIIPIDRVTEVELDDNLEVSKTYNYSDYKLYLEFLDENKELLPIAKTEEVEKLDEDEAESISDDETTEAEYHMQINPTGYMTINIHYIRGENED